MIKEQPPPITPLEFEPDDHDTAAEMAKRLGYSQYAYTSTSALWGLFCLPENIEHARIADKAHPNRTPYRSGCIIKTQEFGLLFVQDREDLGLVP